MSGELIWQLSKGTCDGGDCDRWAVSLAFDDRLGELIPVCRRHITVYRVVNNTLWQAEDEFAGLRYARRSRFRWLAQRRILHDQRVAAKGRVSWGQRRVMRRLARLETAS